MLEAYVALLRGINVGGKNKLPVRDLTALCAEAGCADVRCYVQSGNIVFESTATDARGIPARIATQIAERFGFRIPIALRTLEQLKRVVGNNPFLEQGASEEALHVMFLDDPPSPEKVAGLDPSRSAGDAFAVRGQEIYLHLPNGVADTKLTNACFDARLTTISANRNWKTITKLLVLMRQ